MDGPGSPRLSPGCHAGAPVLALAFSAAGTYAVDIVRGGRTRSDAPAGVAGETAITIANFTFAPKSVTVKAGTSIQVTNSDSAAHTFTSGVTDHPGGAFDLHLDGGASGTVNLPRAGTVTYFCSIHPGMKGTIKVTP